MTSINLLNFPSFIDTYKCILHFNMEITQCNAYGMDIKATINDKDPSNMFAGDMPKKKKKKKN